MKHLQKDIPIVLVSNAMENEEKLSKLDEDGCAKSELLDHEAGVWAEEFHIPMHRTNTG